MQVIDNLQEWQHIRQNLSPRLSIGFIPTMGNLHQGHASLFQASKRDNDINIASIFVNPTQFNQREDFIHYPKTLDADLALLQHSGIDYCLLPTEEALYPEGYRYRIEETKLSLHLEGEKRPGHFNGVLTIVMMLFNLVKPHHAYFGEKDFQQYRLIRDMANAFFLDIDVKLCPTIRDISGLAFSSRNNRLNPQERILADKFATIFHQPKTCATIIAELNALGIAVEYIEDYHQRRFAAVQIGAIRLIDNYALEPST